MQTSKMNAETIDKQEIVRLIDQQRPDWSLEQAFYTDSAIFSLERDLWFPRQWMLVAHASEIPETGRHIVRRLFGEEIIVVRFGDGEEDIAAYYNVCTHRGSRLCTKDGRGRLLLCPYHAWSFRLTGELQSRQDLPENVDPEALGLHRVPVKSFGGLVFCGLDDRTLPDIEPVANALTGHLCENGLDRARIVARKSYPTNANWKLVIENFFECYHCRPAHPEYSRVNGHIKVTGTRNPAKAIEWQNEVEAWHSAIGDTPFKNGVWEAGDIDTMSFAMHRKPIGSGRKTLSDSGEPVSCLMGGRKAYDSGENGFRLGRLSFVSAANDYVTLFQMIPRSATETEVILTWLVDQDAEPNIDADAISWMWDVTTVQDKKITEDNAHGVMSRAYRPGPYTPLESQTSSFVQTYLSELRSLLTGTRTAAVSQWAAPSELFGSPKAASRDANHEQAVGVVLAS